MYTDAICEDFNLNVSSILRPLGLTVLLLQQK